MSNSISSRPQEPTPPIRADSWRAPIWRISIFTLNSLAKWRINSRKSTRAFRCVIKRGFAFIALIFDIADFHFELQWSLAIARELLPSFASQGFCASSSLSKISFIGYPNDALQNGIFTRTFFFFICKSNQFASQRYSPDVVTIGSF